MPNKNFKKLVDFIRTVAIEKFDLTSYGVLEDVSVGITSLNKQIFHKCGTTACALGYWRMHFNPNFWNLKDCEKEFGLTEIEYRTLFLWGGTIVDKYKNNHFLGITCEPGEWADIAEAFLDGGKVIS